ncbi:MAG TPA: hypothetical protein VMS02_05210, partial [Solirubrobacteraceae bacterium]|nr:hypothetical protein [Solirubrobacteraceae bacterium]
MPLTLVLGPANSAKAGELFGAYADAAHRGGWLVVPNARDAEHYRRELAEQGVVLGSVVTFTGLAEEIARRGGYGGRRVTELQLQQLLARAVRRAELSSLARSAETAGFARALGELISELERSLVSPDRFTRAMAQRSRYAREVAALYAAYAHELERRGRVDGELFTWRALDALRAAPGSWGSEPVFFYGFDDLHALQLDAVETLARMVGVEVMVSLTYEPGRGALRARADVVEQLRPLAERVLQLPAADEHYETASRRVLHHLERHLFEDEPPSTRPHAGQAVQLLEAAGERAEAELIAAEVLALVRAGVAAEEIAVVDRSPTAGLPAVFEEYGIPLRLERRVPLRATALGQGLLALARCALLPDASAGDLLRYLRAPGVLERPELADALELEVRRQGLGTVVQARARTPLALRDIDATASAGDPAEELVRQGRRMLAAPHRGSAALLDHDAALDAAALAAMAAALDELDELGLRPAGSELIGWLETLELQAPVAPAEGAVLL